MVDLCELEEPSEWKKHHHVGPEVPLRKVRERRTQSCVPIRVVHRVRDAAVGVVDSHAPN